MLNVKGVYWGTSTSIASVYQLTYRFTETLQKRKCRKICVINCRSKSRQELFIEIAVWEDTKVNILTAALPTLAILWPISQFLLLFLKLHILCIMGSFNHLSSLTQETVIGKSLTVGTPEAENKWENIKRHKFMF